MYSSDDHTRSDLEWVEALRGDHGADAQYVAYDDLSKLLHGRVFRLLCKWQVTVPGLAGFEHADLEELAQDFVQSSLLKIYEERVVDVFRFDARFSTYITSVTRNVILAELRLKKWQSYRGELPDDDPDGPSTAVYTLPTLNHDDSAQSSPADAQSQRELWACLEECVALLPERWRNAFLWRVVEQMDIAETQRRLQASSEQTVYGIVHRARLRLKECLAAKGWPEDEIWRLVE